MNPEALLNHVTELMDYARSIGLTRVHLCFWQGKLDLLHPAHTTERHTVFTVIAGKQLYEGLTPNEWDHLSAKLLHFFKERNLCPKHQKH